jgi:hypothetical protein
MIVRCAHENADFFTVPWAQLAIMDGVMDGTPKGVGPEISSRIMG